MKAIGTAIFLVTLAGCGTPVSNTHQIAIPGPLEKVSVSGARVSGPAGFRMVDTKVVAPMVVGSHGDGLNMATSVYRTFQAMGIHTEVRCCYPETSHTRMEIRFPEGLSPSQRDQVQRVLTLIFGPGTIGAPRVSRR